jgi:molecular chaperone DnaK
VKQKTEALTEASMKLGQAMYESAQAEQAHADARSDSAKDDNDDVVDADFEELDDDDKKKRA